MYEIVIFTASSKDYAEEIIKKLDPNNEYIDFILSREDCMVTRNGFYLKDLRILKDRKLTDMIIVDNLAHSFGFQVDNGIPILEWTGNQNDQELLHLQELLAEANTHEDVRKYLKKRLGLRRLAAEDPQQLISIIKDNDLL